MKVAIDHLEQQLRGAKHQFAEAERHVKSWAQDREAWAKQVQELERAIDKLKSE